MGLSKKALGPNFKHECMQMNNINSNYHSGDTLYMTFYTYAEIKYTFKSLRKNQYIDIRLFEMFILKDKAGDIILIYVIVLQIP